MCNCFSVKVSVSNFKVEKSENLDNAFCVFTFLDMTFPKNVTRFFGFSKKREKRILELCVRVIKHSIIEAVLSLGSLVVLSGFLRTELL